jgi:hypothetical protein
LAQVGDLRANFFADVAEAAFSMDAALASSYHSIEDGKWDGMMSDVHMNYVIWQTPEEQTPPKVVRFRVDSLADQRIPEIVFVPEAEIPTTALVLGASSYDRSFSSKGLKWTPIPHLGQSEAAMMALPQGLPPTTIEDSVRLEYDFFLDRGQQEFRVTFHLTPTLDTRGSGGLRLGASLDDGPVFTLLSNLQPTAGAPRIRAQRAWEEAVKNNGHDVRVVFEQVPPGEHTLKLWRLDDNVVVEGVVIGG